MKFTKSVSSQPPFEVIVRAVDHQAEVEEEERRLGQMIDNLDGPIERFSCGVDVDGNRDDDLTKCENIRYDEDDDFEPYCLIKYVAKRRQHIEDLKWVPNRIEYCWQTGIGSEGWGFFDRNGFVRWYELVIHAIR